MYSTYITRHIIYNIDQNAGGTCIQAVHEMICMAMRLRMRNYNSSNNIKEHICCYCYECTWPLVSLAHNNAINHCHSLCRMGLKN